MKTFRHILFPVDFSERCEAALPAVTAWAHRFDAKVTLLHTVYIPISMYGGSDTAAVIIDPKAMETSAQERLNRVDLPGAAKIVTLGDPAFDIVQYAEQNGVDLIMIPTHGYGTFRALLLGSVAAKVLHDAQCAVWTSAHAEVSKGNEIGSILCAVEGGQAGAELIREADDLAQACKAELRLIRAVPVDETRPEKYLEGDLDAALVKMAKEEIAEAQRLAGTNLEASVKAGAVSRVVREAALECKADLVITGRGKLHETFGRLRSNGYAIIRDSPCPVLSK
jgi:nucleotide-binding universal stress UspA family protein